MQRYVSNAVDALVRAEHNKCTNDYLLPGSPYQMLDINVPNNEGNPPFATCMLQPFWEVNPWSSSSFLSAPMPRSRTMAS